MFYFENWWRKFSVYSPLLDSGGFRLTVGNLRQVEETSSSSRTAPWLDLIGQDWAGLQDAAVRARCADPPAAAGSTA